MEKVKVLDERVQIRSPSEETEPFDQPDDRALTPDSFVEDKSNFPWAF